MARGPAANVDSDDLAGHADVPPRSIPGLLGVSKEATCP
eukprot:CAMPEP_0174290580 /NCGR_PEP_ID=MMETSP0809-20121228/29413_1 /TAXON_ID=73025 ORGANISM="Eutreptiella gymnastica-like, Strain CCMP1594" /NCGR_SAMPLE_ID=MMETSP0809 /ASSEMBLY_ACC=CAM_ASM_000658 /LENGTH=38 /DNA_ID= /DNA_START= /DNA_END= /DNA_ORIENTATION=